MNLSQMSVADLRKLQDEINLQLKKCEQQEMNKAREKILAIAQSVGVPLKELMGKPARISKAGTVAVQYRHPADASLQWTGRGRKPQWVNEWLASGKTLDEVRV